MMRLELLGAKCGHLDVPIASPVEFHDTIPSEANELIQE
jgi:hypothetical protein